MTPPSDMTPGTAKQALFDLRRENFNLVADKRRLQLELEMIKASGEGGEQRVRERQHYEE